MRSLKSAADIAKMRQAGLLVWEAHQVAADRVKPGVTTAEINDVVERFLQSRHAIPLFKGVPGKVPFPAATCISINDEVVHGIPGNRRLQEGDLVSVDIGAKLNGWCGDAAVTHPVGAISAGSQRLLEITEGTLALAIELMGKRRRWSQVAREMASYVRSAGLSVVEGLVGHSIGREMWEGLQVPNYSDEEFERKHDFVLKPGMVLAVEPMINLGAKEIQILDDHWTIVTADGLPSAHFEHTIALTHQGPVVLTAGPNGSGWAVKQKSGGVFSSAK